METSNNVTTRTHGEEESAENVSAPTPSSSHTGPVARRTSAVPAGFFELRGAPRSRAPRARVSSTRGIQRPLIQSSSLGALSTIRAQALASNTGAARGVARARAPFRAPCPAPSTVRTPEAAGLPARPSMRIVVLQTGAGEEPGRWTPKTYEEAGGSQGNMEEVAAGAAGGADPSPVAANHDNVEEYEGVDAVDAAAGADPVLVGSCAEEDVRAGATVETGSVLEAANDNVEDDMGVEAASQIVSVLMEDANTEENVEVNAAAGANCVIVGSGANTEENVEVDAAAGASFVIVGSGANAVAEDGAGATTETCSVLVGDARSEENVEVDAAVGGSCVIVGSVANAIAEDGAGPAAEVGSALGAVSDDVEEDVGVDAAIGAGSVIVGFGADADAEDGAGAAAEVGSALGAVSDDVEEDVGVDAANGAGSVIVGFGADADAEDGAGAAAEAGSALGAVSDNAEEDVGVDTAAVAVPVPGVAVADVVLEEVGAAAEPLPMVAIANVDVHMELDAAAEPLHGVAIANVDVQVEIGAAAEPLPAVAIVNADDQVGVGVAANALRQEVELDLNVIALQRRGIVQIGTRLCPFFENDCRATFLTPAGLEAHILNCFFGVLQCCKEEDCNTNDGRVHIVPQNFALHATTHHHCNSTPGRFGRGLVLALDPGFLTPPRFGYNLRVLRRFHFSVDTDRVNVLLAAIVQNVGVNRFRLMLVALMYAHDGTPLRHMVEMICSVRGRDGQPILPFAYPGYNASNPVSSTTTYVFNSSRQIIEASELVDGLISYTTTDLQALALPGTHPDEQEHVLIDVDFLPFRAVVWDLARFPLVQYALTWDDLMLEPGVRETMDDGELPSPSELTRIIVPQIKGQADVIIEALDADGVTNAVTTGIVDEILKLRPQRHLPNRNAVAIIVYPTISILRRYQSMWIQRARALGLEVVVLDNYYDCIKNHMKRFGVDIVLAIPSQYYNALNVNCNETLRLLTQDVRFLYFHHHHKNCFADIKTKIEESLTHIPFIRNGTIRIGFLERMTDIVENMSENPGLTYPGANPRAVERANRNPRPLSPAMFNRKWTMMYLGPPTRALLQGLNETVLQNMNLAETISAIRDAIMEGVNKRWVVFQMVNEVNSDAVKALTGELETTLGKEHVTSLTSENDIIRNATFWDPFLHRNHTTVMMGPFFLLDCAEIAVLDGAVLFTPSVHDADKVRLAQLLQRDDNQFNPVLSVPLHNIRN